MSPSVELPSDVVRPACERLLGNLMEHRLEQYMSLAAEGYGPYLKRHARRNLWRRLTFRKPIPALTPIEFHEALCEDALNCEQGTHPFHHVNAQGAELERDLKDVLLAGEYAPHVEVSMDLLRAFKRAEVPLDLPTPGRKIGFL